MAWEGKYFFTKTAIIVIVLIVLASIPVFFIAPYYQNGTVYDSFPEVSSQDRILIFAPHPDDETLGTAGIIREAIEKNATVKVVIVTDGRNSHTPALFESYLNSINSSTSSKNSTLPEVRHEEAINALEEIGLDQNNVIFLGFPDGGIRPMFNDYWDSNNTFKSGPDDHSPYNFSYQKNVPYAGKNVASNIEDIIKSFKPTIIFYPDDGDFHEDHWGTSAFVRYAAMETNYTGHEYTYLVHKGKDWPNPSFYLPNATLTPHNELTTLDADWMLFSLNKSQENLKDKAVNAYGSQLYLWRNYLLSFIRVNEIYAKYPVIEVDSVSNDPNFFVEGMPDSSFQDVRGDPKTGLLQSSDDLTSLGMAYDDHYAYLVVQTADKIDSNLVDRYQLILWNGIQFKSLDIKVQDNVAEYEIRDNSSVIPDEKPQVQVEGNMMVIKVPLSAIRGTKELLLTATVFNKKGDLIDFIAARNLNFKDDW